MTERDDVQRVILPMPDRQHVGVTTYDAKDPATRYPPIEPVRPPEGAPNVVIVLIDDAGFGASSAFGGPCNTPNFERLARDGLKYTRFHTTALCSPTRAALLSGRNHHSVGMGGITEIATSAPGYSSIRPRSMAPIAEVLKLNGYSTAHFGKCHEVLTPNRRPGSRPGAPPVASPMTTTCGSSTRPTTGHKPVTSRRTIPINSLTSNGSS